MPPKISLIGQTFGKLKVVSESPTRAGCGSVRWVCVCECGGDKVVTAPHLKKGYTTSCGCVRDHQHKYGSVTHGHMTNGPSPTYATWRNMLSRCTNTKNPGYADYGGRGITVCARWYKFENFLADMGERPLGLLIDRKNNNRGYEPGNCRWVTRSISNQNRRPFKRNAL